MERILVAIDGKQSAWQALSHAFFLAKRIDAQVNVLLILPSLRIFQTKEEKERQDAVTQRLSYHIEKAQVEGIRINLFFTEGHYAEEVIRFVNQNKITLVMHEAEQGDMRTAMRESSFLQSLRLRVNCRVEVIAPKKQ